MIILNEEDLVIYLKESVVNRSRIVGIFDFMNKIVDKVRLYQIFTKATQFYVFILLSWIRATKNVYSRKLHSLLRQIIQ